MRAARDRIGETGALLGLVLLCALVPLAILIGKALSQHGTLTGATGLFPADQLQYLAWIRDAGQHGLAASKFDLVATRHVLLDPLFETSGLLWRAGLAIQLAYLAWLPVTLALLFCAFRAYVRRTLTDRRDRQTALGLALFFGTPVLPLLVWRSALGARSKLDFLQMSVDTTPALQLWGYFPIALTLAAFAAAMLWTERILDDAQPRRHIVRASAAAVLIGWLHPWQGATLIVILLALMLTGRPRRRHALLALPVAAAAVPLIYYALLPHIDRAWRIAHDQNLLGPQNWRLVIATVAPLALLAAGRPRLAGLGTQSRILLIWPASALLVYWAAPPYPVHALETISLPLAVLAMRGWHFLPARRALLTAAAIVLTVPGTVYAALKLRDVVRVAPTIYILPRDDARAMHFIDRDPAPGGVLAPSPEAIAVPGLTDRETWIGHPSWTTAFDLRTREAGDLFMGHLPAAGARRRVLRIGAAIVFAPCGSSPAFAATMTSLGATGRRFGCATVWQLRR